MRFCDLFGEQEDKRRILSLSCDSRTAKEGSLFFCVRGARQDGHDFAADAYKNGCRHFVAERSLSLPGDAAVFLCRDTEEEMARVASVYYGEPARRLSVIGVTGTKGKTSTAYMIREMLESTGIRTGYIGSLGILYDGVYEETQNTTPGCIELQKTLAAMVTAGIRTVAIEVSSQALSRGRVLGIPFAVSVFTNLSRDHIGEGEHVDMRNYREAKLSLFSRYTNGTVVLNAEEPFSKKIAAVSRGNRALRYGGGHASDLRIGKCVEVRAASRLGMVAEFSFRGEQFSAYLPFFGRHYAENLAAALLASSAVSGQAPQSFLGCVRDMRIPGRCEIIPAPGAGTFVIDYAHNGASLAMALRGLRPYTNGRLFCLFGAVGERTQCRRADMARAASRYADFSVITEDNPGEESLASILTEVFLAFPKKENAICIPDRCEAIRYLYDLSLPGDIVLLAGKGNEGYQLRRGGRIPFSESELLKSFFTV